MHPFAVQVLARRGIDISQATSKHLDSFLDQSFDVVITVCDRMHECCPVFPEDGESIHWSLPDPVALEGLSASEHVVAFEQLAEELTTRIQHLLALLASEQKKSRKTA